MIYLDNAATSYPKPFEVIGAVNRAFSIYGANPGRSGHDLSVTSAMCVYSAREELNELFGGFGSEFVSFTKNCTEALNIAIKGVIKKGGTILISSLEHNSVARPVYTLSQNGIANMRIFEVGENAKETVNNFKEALSLYKPELCVVTAVSNVFGNILPLSLLSREAHKAGALFFVDGAQGAGVIELNMKKQGIDCLCVPGHKGLLGPMGTGALLHNGCIENTVLEGGTGTSSFELSQPKIFPEMLEAGTVNVPGIAGLRAGAKIVSAYGVKNIFEEESELVKQLYDGLKNIDGVILYGDYTPENFAPLLSFNIKNMHSETVSSKLNKNAIAVRGGFHCAPLAHNAMGTSAFGAVRVSPSRFTSKKDINILLNVVNKICNPSTCML